MNYDTCCITSHIALSLTIEIRGLPHIFNSRSMIKQPTLGWTVSHQDWVLIYSSQIYKRKATEEFKENLHLKKKSDLWFQHSHVRERLLSKNLVSLESQHVVALKFRNNWINCFSCVIHAGQYLLTSLSPINANSSKVNLRNHPADEKCSQGRLIWADCLWVLKTTLCMHEGG